MKPGYLCFLEGVLRRLVLCGALVNLVVFAVWFAFQSNGVYGFAIEAITDIHSVSFIVWSLLIVVWGAVLVASRARSALLTAALALIAIASSSVLFLMNKDGLNTQVFPSPLTREALIPMPWALERGVGPTVEFSGDCSGNPVHSIEAYSPYRRLSFGTVFDRYFIDCQPRILGVLINGRLLFGFSPFLVLILLAWLGGVKTRWAVAEPERAPSRFLTPTTLAAAFLVLVAMESFYLNGKDWAVVSLFIAVFPTAFAAIASILWNKAGLVLSFVLGLGLSTLGVDGFLTSNSLLDFGDGVWLVVFSGLALIAISFAFGSVRNGQQARVALPVAS